MTERDLREVARDAWSWPREAKRSHNRTERDPPEALAAIQAMSLAAMAAMAAEQATY